MHELFDPFNSGDISVIYFNVNCEKKENTIKLHDLLKT